MQQTNMSKLYIQNKHCKQRTGLVLGATPFVAAELLLGLWHALLAPLPVDLPLEPSHAQLALHPDLYTSVSQ